jgi:hypothetical protein
MIELTADEKKVLALIVAEKDIQPPNDSVMTEEQENIAWHLKDLGLAINEDIPDDDTYSVWRPTFDGLAWKEEQ